MSSSVLNEIILILLNVFSRNKNNTILGSKPKFSYKEGKKERAIYLGVTSSKKKIRQKMSLTALKLVEPFYQHGRKLRSLSLLILLMSCLRSHLPYLSEISFISFWKASLYLPKIQSLITQPQRTRQRNSKFCRSSPAPPF